MSEMSFEQMLEESFKTIRNGEVVEGTVIDVKPDEIFLNIGYKSDGIITRNEYTNEPNVDLTTVVKVGDKMEAKVVKLNDGEGQVILSYKRLQAEKGSKRLEEAFENQEVLKAKVTQVLAGGVCVSVDETRVFILQALYQILMRRISTSSRIRRLSLSSQSSIQERDVLSETERYYSLSRRLNSRKSFLQIFMLVM